MTLKASTLEKLEALKVKFDNRGQDVDAYLDGLMESEFLSYWEYVHLETLLSLQTPRTNYPDESIFIMYHQISELYFKLCLHEMEQITACEEITEAFLLNKVKRLNNYFKALIGSYEIMVDGMEKDQFLKFRMALLPASGFQSAQFRKIAFYATDLSNLANGFGGEVKEGQSISERYENIYWKKGAIDLKTGQKTLTLKQFEEHYDEELIALATKLESCNLNTILDKISVGDELKSALRMFDVQANINWPLSHYKSAVRYLKKDPVDVEATGGTNWQSYLPPKFQKVSFFPSIWSEKDLAEWGKSWVESI
jgi:tryptophan 2,3-dioxygenase